MCQLRRDSPGYHRSGLPRNCTSSCLLIAFAFRVNVVLVRRFAGTCVCWLLPYVVYFALRMRLLSSSSSSSSSLLLLSLQTGGQYRPWFLNATATTEAILAEKPLLYVVVVVCAHIACAQPRTGQFCLLSSVFACANANLLVDVLRQASKHASMHACMHAPHAHRTRTSFVNEWRSFGLRLSGVVIESDWMDGTTGLVLRWRWRKRARSSVATLSTLSTT